MKKEDLLKVLLAPHLSEKSVGQYIFKVAKCASKHDVKVAVEQLFQVSVKAVNVVNVKGAAATKFGRKVGRRASWKKAYVSVSPGQEINIV